MNLDQRAQEAYNMHLAGHTDVAVPILEDILKQQPKNTYAIDNLFSIYWGQQRFKEADELLGRIIKKHPNPSRLINKGVTSFVVRNFYESIEHLNKVIKQNLNPDLLVLALNARSSTLKALDNPEGALRDALNVIKIDSNNVGGWTNAGAAYFDLNNNEKAIEYFTRAYSLVSGDPSVGLNLAVALIKNGDFKTGWEVYQCRFPLLTVTNPTLNFSAPRWNGIDDIKGKKILLVEEQGAGDTILFSRYVPMLKEKGATLILESAASMVPLMQQFKEFETVTNKSSYDQPYDYYVWMASFPYIFKTTVDTIPTPDRYIKAEPAKVSEWSEKLGPKTKLRVGVAWSGNPEFLTDNKRSMKLAEFLKALPPGPEYICLQKDLREVDKKVIKKSGIKFVGNEFNDFTDTAAVIELVDLVVSTCTSVANLAGAMGKKTFVIIPFGSDWRWPGDPSTSLWYTSVSCYRQHKHGDWSKPLSDIRGELTRIINNPL